MTEIMDQSDLADRAAALVAAARRAGADAADAVCVRGVSLSVDVRLGKVEETNRSEGNDFTLRVFVGKRTGVRLGQRLRRSVGAGRRAPSPWRASRRRIASPASPTRTCWPRIFPDRDLLDETIPTAAELTEIALAAEDAARAVPGRRRIPAAPPPAGRSAAWCSPPRTASPAPISPRASASPPRPSPAPAPAWSATTTANRRSTAPISTAPETIGQNAGERAVRRLNPRKMPSGRVTVVYDPRIATSLIGHLAGAINGASIARKTSFLRERWASRCSRRRSPSPTTRRARAASLRGPFDGEGVAGKPLELVKDGVLQTWLLDSATARELGLVTNGRASRAAAAPSPSTTNLTLLPGGETPEEMIRDIGSGVYVTELIGHGASIVTGDYSRGAAGFVIENGEIGHPVSEITIAGNLKDMFREMRAANDLTYRRAIERPDGRRRRDDRRRAVARPRFPSRPSRAKPMASTSMRP